MSGIDRPAHMSVRTNATGRRTVFRLRMQDELQDGRMYATNIESIAATRTIGSGLIETRDLHTGHQLVRATFPSGEDWVPGCAEIVLAHVCSGRFTMIRDIGAGSNEAHWRPGQILLTPDRAPGISRWAGAPPVSTLEIGIPAHALSRAAVELYGKGDLDLEPLCRVPLDDMLMSQALLGLWSPNEAALPPPRLLVEQCVELILLQLARRTHDHRRPPPRSGRTALAPWALKHVIDLVEARLDEDLSLADLAGAARLSASHFARAFKLTTGVAPYRYVVARRIGRAQSLLADTRLPIIEVAARCGFSDPGHFATLFRRETGYSPRQYRNGTGRV